MKPAYRYLDLDVTALLAYTADMGTLAERVGVTRRTLHRLVHTGLTLDQADEFALALGVHPTAPWPCWPTPVKVVRCTYCRRCSRLIVQPIRPGARLRRVCSTRCRNALDWSRHSDARRAASRIRYAARKRVEEVVL